MWHDWRLCLTVGNKLIDTQILVRARTRSEAVRKAKKHRRGKLTGFQMVREGE